MRKKIQFIDDTPEGRAAIVSQAHKIKNEIKRHCQADAGQKVLISGPVVRWFYRPFQQLRPFMAWVVDAPADRIRI